MKRIIALFAVFALTFILCYHPVKADGTTWTLPFSSVKDLIQIAEELFSGAEVDLATISNQMLGLYDYVFARRTFLDENGIYIPELTLDQANALNIGLSALALDGQEEFTALSDLTIPIPSGAIANFIGNNRDWINRYRSSDSLVVSPDENYLSVLDVINGSGFWFSSYSNINGFGQTGLFVYPPNLCSWYTQNSWNNSVGALNYCWTYDILSLHITSVNGLYNLSIDLQNAITNFHITGDTYNKYGLVNNGVGGYYGFDSMGSDALPSNINYTGTLQEVMSFVQSRFKNVNIYVDDELWSYAGGVPGDAFIQLGTVALGDLGTYTYPVYSLDGADDLGLDMGAFANWLDGVIRSGATAISLEDLITDGIAVVDTTTGERAITDDDAEDVAKVIAGEYATTGDPSGSPTPSPTSDPWKNRIPALKIIPPLLDPSLRPSDIPRQTTVLSEIIDATNKTVPQDIMILFWSTIGLLVIGGLIYIMHK